MRALSLLSIFSIVGVLIVVLFVPVEAASVQQTRPTAPPPPSGDSTQKPPTQKPSNKTKPPVYNNPKITLTPTATATLTAPATLTPTATFTPTLTPTLTPTPFLNLQIVVYLDTNANHAFDVGEGVDGLRTLIDYGTGSIEQTTQIGRIQYVLPADMQKGDEVQIQIPYLHYSKTVSYRPDEVIVVEHALVQPKYPVLLP